MHFRFAGRLFRLAFVKLQRGALRSARYRDSTGSLSESCTCALVFYAGVPLSESQGNLSIFDQYISSPRLVEQQCYSFQINISALSTLESLHRAMLHGDIRRANTLIVDLGVTIIDFGHSEQCDDQGAKDKELAQ